MKKNHSRWKCGNHYCLSMQKEGILLEDGLFRIYAGGNSRDCLMQELRIAF